MAAILTLDAEARDAKKNIGTGTRVARRLRASGRIPAIIYGHKQANLPITLSSEDVWKLIKAQAHLAELRVGGARETVLVRQVQWDHLGREVIHVDFFRKDPDEEVETLVTLEARGTAAGVGQGGMLEWLTHEIKIHCKAGSIPDVIKFDVSGLELNQVLHAREIPLPEGVTFKGDPDLAILHIAPKRLTEEPAAAATAEPTVIKKEKAGKEGKEG